MNPEIKEIKEIEIKERNPEDQVATGSPASGPRKNSAALSGERGQTRARESLRKTVSRHFLDRLDGTLNKVKVI